MQLRRPRQRVSWFRKAVLGTALSLGVLVAPIAAPAQTVTMFGALSNFDVLNDTGENAHGFEIELHGLQPSDVPYTFGGTYTHYGQPSIVPFPGGVYVRYMSSWDPIAQQFTAATLIAPKTTVTNGHVCFSGALPGYDTSGCEHFGVSTYTNPTKTVYRWLIADPAAPGQLQPFGTPVAIPAPSWIMVPPAQVGAAPVVVAEVQAPIPPAPAKLFGEAQWMKVYKTEHAREVGLDELLDGNPVVPQDPAQIEVEWDLIQADVADVGGQKRRGQKANQGALGGGSRAVVRRYELFKYAGVYDDVTHEALCADGLCVVPAEGELGDYIGAQMAAANVGVPSVTITNVAQGGARGDVVSADKLIKCGTACSATYNAGTVVTLTAVPKSAGKDVFAGWGGACNGTQLTCVVTVNEVLNVTATFVAAAPAPPGGGGGNPPASTFTLSAKTAGGKGSIVSAPAGIDCGKTCSVRVASGASVALTATPEAGFRFVNWSGACSGTAPSCDVTVNGNTSVQANFAK